MKYDINTLRGIAPGKLIGHELKKRSISQRAIASELDIHSPDTQCCDYEQKAAHD